MHDYRVDFRNSGGKRPVHAIRVVSRGEVWPGQPFRRIFDWREIGDRFARIFRVRENQQRTEMPGDGELLDLAFPIYHQENRRTLHPARRQPFPGLAAEFGADHIADQPVQDPAGLLCGYSPYVDGSRVGECGLDGGRRNFVKSDP